MKCLILSVKIRNLCCLIKVISHDIFYLIGSLIFCMMLLVSLSACFLIQLMEIDLLL